MKTKTKYIILICLNVLITTVYGYTVISHITIILHNDNLIISILGIIPVLIFLNILVLFAMSLDDERNS